MKRALVTGVTGQIGSYLAERLLAEGTEVHGVIRRHSQPATQRIDAVYDHPLLSLHYGDLVDAGSVGRLVAEVRPDEVFHLAAQSHVRTSFDLPGYTAEAGFLGTLHLLEALRSAGLARTTRFYHAGTSEMFGRSPAPQSEETPFLPASPYAVAKLAAHRLVDVYRRSYGMFAVSGILFNSESPRRGETFVTRKITRYLGKLKAHLGGRRLTIGDSSGELAGFPKLALGNLAAKRDWGYAPEYADAIARMVRQSEPRDLVVGTGESHTVAEFLEAAVAAAGVCEGYARSVADLPFLAHDARFDRPLEVPHLEARPALAARHLGWEAKTRFAEIVRVMVERDVALAAPHECPPPY